jgi:hypothetical protein
MARGVGESRAEVSREFAEAKIEAGAIRVGDETIDRVD